MLVFPLNMKEMILRTTESLQVARVRSARLYRCTEGFECHERDEMSIMHNIHVYIRRTYINARESRDDELSIDFCIYKILPRRIII